MFAGSDEWTYLARRPGPAGAAAAPLRVMFPVRWPLDDVRVAAAQILQDTTATPVDQPGSAVELGTVRLYGLPGLPV